MANRFRRLLSFGSDSRNQNIVNSHELQEPQNTAQIERRDIDQIIEEPDGRVILKFDLYLVFLFVQYFGVLGVHVNLLYFDSYYLNQKTVIA